MRQQRSRRVSRGISCNLQTTASSASLPAVIEDEEISAASCRYPSHRPPHLTLG
ncbi:hypothetical protein J6590_096904 [Homalodisca vitripennis]|nr:hypothetical protein J6590_096904 [Homalodisca vitripennis]